MELITIDPYCVNFPIEKQTELEKLFQKAKNQEWEHVFAEICKNPHLINATPDSGPDAGKTVLWIAASSLWSDKSIAFIDKLLRPHFDLNFDAAPIAGVDKGKTAAWLISNELNTLKERDIANLFRNILEEYDFNINAAPDEDYKKGVTLFCNVISKPCGDIIFWKSILLPLFKKTQLILNANFQEDNLAFRLLNILNRVNRNKWDCDPEIIGKIYSHVLKMVQVDPEIAIKDKIRKLNSIICSSNYKVLIPSFAPRTLLEAALVCPPAAERTQLLIYLILLNGKLSDSAEDWKMNGSNEPVEAPWKKEYEGLREKLKTTFEHARNTCLNYLGSNSQMHLLPEHRINIALNMIWSTFPELEKFPIERLKSMLIYKTYDT